MAQEKKKRPTAKEIKKMIRLKKKKLAEGKEILKR